MQSLKYIVETVKIWLRERPEEKLLLVLVAVSIGALFVAGNFYRNEKETKDERISDLRSQLDTCKSDRRYDAAMYKALEREFRTFLMQSKFNISERLDSISDEKIKIN